MDIAESFDVLRPACSAVLISEKVALTARHCLTGESWRVGPGEGIKVLGYESHEELDLAVLYLDPCVPWSGHPLALGLDEPTLDETLLIAGYGDRGEAEGGDLYAVSTQVAMIEQNTLRVDSGFEAGACIGDSGGPLLRELAPHEYELLGILSAGSADCRGVDSYVRIDIVESWIADVLQSREATQACSRERSSPAVQMARCATI